MMPHKLTSTDSPTDNANLWQRIAELEQTNAALQQRLSQQASELQLFRTIVEHAPDGIGVARLDGCLTYANPAYCTMLGRELVGTSALDMCAEEPDYLLELIQQVAQHGQWAGSLTFRHKDGSTLTGQVSAVGIYDAEGIPQAIAGIVRDSTEQTQAEAALHESESRLQAVFQHSAVPIGFATLEGIIFDTNPAYQHMFGYTQDELCTMTWLDLAHPDDLTVDMATHCELIAGQRDTYQFEKRMVRKGGQIVWVHLVVSLVRDANGRPLFVTGMLEDITERKQATEAYHTLVEHSLQGLAIIQAERIVFANQALAQMTGYTVAELLALTTEEREAMTHPEDRLWVWARLQNRLAGQLEPPHYTVRIFHKSGELCWFEVYAARITYQGQPAVQVAYLDITRRMQAEQALRETQALLQGIIDNSPLAIYVKDTQGRFILVNRYLLSQLNLSPAQMLGKTDAELFAPDVTQLAQANDQRVITTGQPLEAEEVADLRDGRHTAISVKFPLVDTQGTIYAVAGISTDITERKQMEAELEHSLALFQAVIESTSDSILVVANDKSVFTYNHKFLDLWQLPTHWPQIPPHERLAMLADRTIDPAAFLTRVQALSNALDAIGYDLLAFKDGRLIERHSYPYRVGEQIVGRLWTFRDVTEQKRAEAALRHARAELDTLITSIPVAIWSITIASDQQVQLNYISPVIEEITGQPVTFFRNVPDAWFSIIHPHDIPTVRPIMRQRMTSSLSEPDIEYRIVLPDGATRWVLDSVSIQHEHGSRRRIDGVLSDITERKQAEATLQRYATIIEATTDIIWMANRQGHILFINQAGRRILGYAPDEDISTVHIAAVHSEHSRSLIFEQGFATALRYGSWRGETSILTRDRREIPVSQVILAHRATDGTPEFFSTIIRDITEQRQAMTNLQQLNRQLEQTIRELEQRNRDIMLLNELGDFLQSCRTVEEAHEVVAKFAMRLFQKQPGALYLLNAPLEHFEMVVAWGMLEQPSSQGTVPHAESQEQRPVPSDVASPNGHPVWPPTASPVSSALAVGFPQETCWALRRGRVHTVTPFNQSMICQHLTRPTVPAYVCAPLIAEGKTLGVLYQQLLSEQPADRCERLITAIASQLALALTNLYLRDQLRFQASHDPLTNLFNRRSLQETLDRELRRAARQKYTLSIIMLDIDHFKDFNTVYGLGGGDATLRALGTFLQRAIRTEDMACRYGGEEFALLLPSATLADAAARAEQVRAGIKAVAAEHNGQVLGTITVSLGVASFPEHGDTVDAVLEAASQALRRAKLAGRDRVVIAEAPEERPDTATNTTTCG